MLPIVAAAAIIVAAALAVAGWLVSQAQASVLRPARCKCHAGIYDLKITVGKVNADHQA